MIPRDYEPFRRGPERSLPRRPSGPRVTLLEVAALNWRLKAEPLCP